MKQHSEGKLWQSWASGCQTRTWLAGPVARAARARPGKVEERPHCPCFVPCAFPGGS